MYNGCDSFDRAAGLLPAALRQRAMSLDRKEKAEAEELRLRIGRPLAQGMVGDRRGRHRQGRRRRRHHGNPSAFEG